MPKDFFWFFQSWVRYQEAPEIDPKKMGLPLFSFSFFSTLLASLIMWTQRFLIIFYKNVMFPIETSKKLMMALSFQNNVLENKCHVAGIDLKKSNCGLIFDLVLKFEVNLG